MPRQALRTLRYPIFTGGVVMANGIYSACFLRKLRRCGESPPTQHSKAVRRMPDGLVALIGKDRSGDGSCYFARPSFFSRFHARMTCTLVTRLCGQEYPRPCQPAMLCLYSVYHNLPALDGFGHESPRKCAETPRKKPKKPLRTLSGRKKGLPHSAVRQSLRGYKGLRGSGFSHAAGSSSKCG